MATDLRNVKGQIASTAAAILTAGDNQEFQINKIEIFNGSGSDVSDIIFYIVPSGGSAATTTDFYEIPSLATRKGRNIPLSGHVLYDGDALYAVAGTGSAVNFIASYQKITG